MDRTERWADEQKTKTKQNKQKQNQKLTKLNHRGAQLPPTPHGAAPNCLKDKSK